MEDNNFSVVQEAQETLVESTIDCQIHGMSKSVSVFGRAQKCEKCIEDSIRKAAERDIDERDNLVRETKAARLVSQSGLPERYIGSTFENYRIMFGADQQNVLDKSIAFADLVGQKGWRSLTLYGDSGTGKTHLLSSILSRAMQHGCTAKYVSFPMLNDRFGRARSFSSEETREDILLEMLAPDILGIDEIGLVGAVVDEYVAGIIYDVINIRYGALKPVVVSTNCGIQELKLVLGDPVIDRLREDGGQFYPMDWTSYRKIGGVSK